MLSWIVVGSALAAECAAADPAAIAADLDGRRWYAAAPCLEKAGFPHVAQRVWAKGIDDDDTRAGAKDALDAMAAIALTTGNDTAVVAAAARLPESHRSPLVAAVLDLAAARDLTVAGSRNEAIERLKKVPPGTPLYVEAQYRLGRLEWERGGKDLALPFEAARAAEVAAADPFVAQQVARWKALSTLALAHQAPDAITAAARIAEVDPAVLPLPVAWTTAWIGGMKVKDKRAWLDVQAARNPAPFLPDAPLLTAGTWLKDRERAAAAVGTFDTAWGPVRDALDAFLDTWQRDPTGAWTAWRTSPAHPSLARDLGLSARVAAYTRDMGLVALEEGRIPADAPYARFAHAELAKVRAESEPRAGRALVAALQSRQERLYTLTSQSKRLREETLPSGSEDPEALRPLTKPLSFLSTDWGL